MIGRKIFFRFSVVLKCFVRCIVTHSSFTFSFSFTCSCLYFPFSSVFHVLFISLHFLCLWRHLFFKYLSFVIQSQSFTLLSPVQRNMLRISWVVTCWGFLASCLMNTLFLLKVDFIQLAFSRSFDNYVKLLPEGWVKAFVMLYFEEIRKWVWLYPN